MIDALELGLINQGTLLPENASGRVHRLRYLIAAGLFLVCMFAKQPFWGNHIFTYDAADYYRAAKVGVMPQYSAADSISLTGFADRYRKDELFRHHPWACLYVRNDGSALRHYHVPLAFYGIAFAIDLGFDRRSQLIIAAVESSAAILAAFFIIELLTGNLFIASAAAFFLALCPVLILSSATISPHPLFSFLSLSTIFFFLAWQQRRGTKYLIAWSTGLGLSIATLELSPILIATLVVSSLATWIEKPGGRGTQAKGVLRGIGLTAIVLAIVWPGGVLRGGYAMSYGVFVFQGLFRSSLYFGDRNFSSSVVKLGHDWRLGIFILVLLLLAIYAALRHHRNVELVTYTVFACLLFGQGLANGFRNPTYASHAVLATSIASALTMNLLRGSGRKADRRLAQAGITLLTVLAAAEGAGVFRASPSEVLQEPLRTEDAISRLRSSYPKGTAFVTTQDPQAFILNAPEFRFAGSVSTDSAEAAPWTGFKRYYLLADLEEKRELRGIALCAPAELKQSGFAVSCGELSGSPATPSGR